MIRNFRNAAFVAALALGATTLATTAEARDRYRDRGDDAALAIGAGIIGLAVGAAIASDRDRGYDRYHDGGYYGPRRGYAAYGYPRSYYPAYPRGYYYDRAPRRFYRNDRGWNGRGWDGPRYRGW
ncbi:hypothetical protein WG901_16310 [Novosphingobium sp. PS1R-30]|uniref:Uncharacterized protein n=1 Tax=Novosphingobium anseongense TaxID=3133436 RepID=A0ABU8RYW8_9SPHN